MIFLPRDNGASFPQHSDNEPESVKVSYSCTYSSAVVSGSTGELLAYDNGLHEDGFSYSLSITKKDLLKSLPSTLADKVGASCANSTIHGAMGGATIVAFKAFFT